MTVPSAELLDRTGRALFDEDFVLPLAMRLGVDQSIVDKWRSGTSRIPHFVYHQLATLVRIRRMMDLQAIENALLTLANEPRKGGLIFGRNVNDGLIQLSRTHTERDIGTLQRSLDDFTLRNDLPSAHVDAHGQTLFVTLAGPLEGSLREAYVDWFNAECDRINQQP